MKNIENVKPCYICGKNIWNQYSQRVNVYSFCLECYKNYTQWIDAGCTVDLFKAYATIKQTCKEVLDKEFGNEARNS